MRSTSLIFLVGCLISGSVTAGEVKTYTPTPRPDPNTMFYAGAGFGQGQYSLKGPLNTDKDVSYGLILGYQFNKNLSGEVKYLNLGTIESSSKIKAKSSALTASLVATYPLNSVVSPYGTIGVSNLSTSWDSAPAAGVSTSQSNTNITWGIGASVDVSQKAALRLSYERFYVGSDNSAKGHMDLWMLSAIFRP